MRFLLRLLAVVSVLVAGCVAWTGGMSPLLGASPAQLIVRRDRPVLTSITPNSGPVNMSAVIAGRFFGTAQENSVLSFNGTPATATAWSNTSITVPVPIGATTGNISLTRGGLTSNTLPFTVTVSTVTVTITVPTSSPTYDAGTASTITVSGTAATDQSLTSCTYTNSLGGSGSASGTTSWSIASVALTVGDNVITVTCSNNVGISNNDVITITRSASGGGCVGTAPQICGESGTLTNGSTLTITGSGFGSKSTAAPAAYEQFEQSGYKPGVWSDTLDRLAGTFANNTSNQRSSFSTKNMKVDFIPSLDTGNMTANLSTAAKWFVSYWYYLDSAFREGNEFVPPEAGGHDCNLANTKVMRFSSPSWSNGDHDTIMNYDTNDDVRVTGQIQNYDDIPALVTPFGTKSTWHRLDVQLQSESGASTNDGSIRIYFDGTLYYTNTAFDTQTAGFTGNMRPYGISFWNSWPGCSTPTHAIYYQDDTYMDNSWARVEIGDGATFATRGHTELQVPSQWTATQIQVTLSQASLTGFSGKYIYVIDSNGNVNSTGFQIP